jgi:hypothetical protein
VRHDHEWRREHATEVGAIDRTAARADSDEATRELVHGHGYPVAPEHDGLASKEVHAPQAVCRVSDERQPRGPGSAGGVAMVFRQRAVHDVLVDADPEGVRDIRGQPNRGLRDLSSTMAWTTVSSMSAPMMPGTESRQRKEGRAGIW